MLFSSVVWLCACGSLGENSREDAVSDNSVYDESNEEVSIDMPVIGEWICSVSDADDVIDVTYGYGNTSLWVESGLPGFGYEMVIDGYLPENDRIVVRTSYGEFSYSYIGSFVAEESGHYLVSGQTKLTNYGKKDEIIWFVEASNVKGYRIYE